PDAAAEAALADGPGRLQVTFPLPSSARADHRLIVDNLSALGFVRVLADGTPLHLGELPPRADLARAKELLVVVDRLAVDPAAPDGARGRLVESLATAFAEGE